MNRDLTSGNPLKRILAFCMPLLVGNLFQQLYAVVDSIIVGKYLGVEPFAAIGSTGSLHGLIIGCAIGLCSGLCIPVAQNYGAGDVRALRKAEANGLYVAAIASLIISVGMGIFTRPILVLFNTPENLLDDACAYIRTLCIGSGSLMLYNMVIGFVRALGDSKMPLFYLVLASIFNILLDLLFVLVFKAGVAGVAYATILAQLLAAFFGILTIRKNFPILRLTRQALKPSLPIMGKISAVALPIGLQCSITAVGSILLQMAINGLGPQAVAAMAVGGKVQGVILAPLDALGVAVMIYVCQNYGGRHLDRIRKGVSQLMLASALYAVFAIAVTWLAGGSFARVFLSSDEVEIHALIQTHLRTSSAFFISISAIYVFRNALQGLGYSNAAMGSGFCEMFARGGVGLFLVGSSGFVGACLGSPFAWTAAGAFSAIVYFYVLRKLCKKADAEGQNDPDGDDAINRLVEAAEQEVERASL